MKQKCTHPEDSLFYYLAPNEDGWKCTCGFQPGEPPGFSPQDDRKQIWIKVYGLLNDLTNADFISLSNGSEADYLTATVADRCVKDDRYDQYSILRFILEEVQPDHARFWTEISEGILSGKDTRNRCHCGKLATTSHYFKGKRTDTCSEHHDYANFFGAIVADEPATSDAKSTDDSTPSSV